MSAIAVFATGFLTGIVALRCAQVYVGPRVARWTAAKAEERARQAKEAMKAKMQSRIRATTTTTRSESDASM